MRFAKNTASLRWDATLLRTLARFTSLLPPQRLHRPPPARADLRGHGSEVRAAGGAGLVQVEAAVHLHHHGGHARVLPVAAGGHQGAGKRAVQLHAPAIRREGLHEGAGGGFAGVKGVGAYADVRANVRAGPAFAGQRSGRKAVAVHHQTAAVARQHAGHRAFQLRVVRVVPSVNIHVTNYVNLLEPTTQSKRQAYN